MICGWAARSSTFSFGQRRIRLSPKLSWMLAAIRYRLSVVNSWCTHRLDDNVDLGAAKLNRNSEARITNI